MKKFIFPFLILVLFLSHSLIAQEYKTTKDGYLAAFKEKDIEKVTDLISIKDYEALQKLIDTGRVSWLRKGVKVQIVDTKIWSGLIKIRPKGKLIEVWTFSEAVE